MAVPRRKRQRTTTDRTICPLDIESYPQREPHQRRVPSLSVTAWGPSPSQTRSSPRSAEVESHQMHRQGDSLEHLST